MEYQHFIVTAGDDFVGEITRYRPDHMNTFNTEMALELEQALQALDQQSVGRKKALELLLDGELIKADRATEMGLVNRVVPKDDLETETRALGPRSGKEKPHCCTDCQKGVLYGRRPGLSKVLCLYERGLCAVMQHRRCP